MPLAIMTFEKCSVDDAILYLVPEPKLALQDLAVLEEGDPSETAFDRQEFYCGRDSFTFLADENSCEVFHQQQCPTAQSKENRVEQLEQLEQLEVQNFQNFVLPSSPSYSSPLRSVLCPNLSHDEASSKATITHKQSSRSSATCSTTSERTSSSGSPMSFDEVLRMNLSTEKSTKWTEREHQLFMTGLKICKCENLSGSRPDGSLRVGLGPGVAFRIAQIVGTRSETQVRSHAQKYFRRLWRRG